MPKVFKAKDAKANDPYKAKALYYDFDYGNTIKRHFYLALETDTFMGMAKAFKEIQSALKKSGCNLQLIEGKRDALLAAESPADAIALHNYLKGKGILDSFPRVLEAPYKGWEGEIEKAKKENAELTEYRSKLFSQPNKKTETEQPSSFTHEIKKRH